MISFLEMGVLIKEYNLPELGKIRLIKSQERSYEESFHGKYYLETSENQIIYEKSESFEELENTTLEIIQDHYRKIIDESERKIIEENRKIGNLETCLEDIEMIDDKKEWLDQYRTNNGLEINNQRMNGKKIFG